MDSYVDMLSNFDSIYDIPSPTSCIAFVGLDVSSFLLSIPSSIRSKKFNKYSTTSSYSPTSILRPKSSHTEFKTKVGST